MKMMRLLTISILLLISVSTFAQESKTSINFNPSGLLYDRPISIELEQRFSDHISVAARVSYVSFHYTRHGNTDSPDETYLGDFFSEGMAGGAHLRVFPFTEGKKAGIYAGIGADLLGGHFYLNSEIVRTNDSGVTGSTSNFDEKLILDYSIPIGYKLDIDRFTLDFSLSYGRNIIRDDYASFFKRVNSDPPVFDRFYPMVAFGFKL